MLPPKTITPLLIIIFLFKKKGETKKNIIYIFNSFHLQLIVIVVDIYGLLAI